MNEYEEEETSSEESLDPKKLAHHYIDQITLAKRRHEEFYNRADKAIKEFLGGGDDSRRGDNSRLNIFNAIINTQLPAYYARTPKSEITLRKKLGNALDNIGAQAIENGSQYCLEECQDFDDVSLAAIKSLLVVGRGVLWERYHVEVERAKEQIPVVSYDEVGFVYPDGTPLQEGVKPIWDGEQYVVVEEYDKVVEEKSITEFVHFKDYLEGPARYESEIEWKARRHYFSKDEYIKEFEEDNPYFKAPEDLDFNTVPEEIKDLGLSKERKAAQGKLAVWEVWCKAKKKILFICEDYEDEPLAIREPAVEIKGFFPCAPALVANVEQDSYIPTCDHYIIKDLLHEVEDLSTRLSHSVEAVKCSALADKQLADALDRMFAEDYAFVPVEDFQKFVQTGGLEDRVLWAPIQHFIAAIQVLGQARNEALSKIYEVTGNSDLLRGTNDPRATAASEQLKGNYANLRFSKRQREIQKFLAAQHKIKAQFMCELFTEETLYEITKFEELEAQIPTQLDEVSGQELKAFTFNDVLEYIRSPYKLYQIDIETDSMVAMDQDAERQQVANYLNSIGQLISQALPAIQQYPTIGELFIAMVDMANAAYRPGKKLDNIQDEMLPKFLAEVQEAKAKADQQANQDPKAVESQVKLQVAQIEAQADQQRVQMEGQKAQMEAQLKQQELQLKQYQAQIELQKLQLEHEKIRLEFVKLGQDAQMKDLEMQGQVVKTAATIQKEAMDTEQATIKAQADIQRAQQQNFKA